MFLANAVLAVSLCLAYTIMDIRGPHGIDSFIDNGIRMLVFGVLYVGAMGSSISVCLARLRSNGDRLGWPVLVFGIILLFPPIVTDQFLRWYLPQMW